MKPFDHSTLSDIMKKQVLTLAGSSLIDTSFIGLNSTPVFTNTFQNNPKYFRKNKFHLDSQPKADEYCRLGVHTASNQTNEKNYKLYWGYKNHVLVDCISGLPIYKTTTTAYIHDSVVTLDILANTHLFLPVTECIFLADKGYDVKNIYNQVHTFYHDECIILLNKHNTKDPKHLPHRNPVCNDGLDMWKDGRFPNRRRTRQKFCYPLKSSKTYECPCHYKNFYNGKNTGAAQNT